MSERDEHAAFPATAMTLIAGLKAEPAVRARSIDGVTRAYWRPVYSYLRLRWRKSPEDAADMTQGFFAAMLERDFFRSYDQLFGMEDVAGGVGDDPLAQGRGGALAQHRLHERGHRLARERAEAQHERRTSAARLDHVRPLVGPRRRDPHEAPMVERLRRLQVLHRDGVGPVEILEQRDHRATRAMRREPVSPGEAALTQGQRRARVDTAHVANELGDEAEWSAGSVAIGPGQPRGSTPRIVERTVERSRPARGHDGCGGRAFHGAERERHARRAAGIAQRRRIGLEREAPDAGRAPQLGREIRPHRHHQRRRARLPHRHRVTTNPHSLGRCDRRAGLVIPACAKVVLVLALAAAGCAPAASPRASTRPPAAEIIDLASEFLTTACRAAPGAEFARAWLAYEDRHRAFFDAIYYDSDEARAERTTLAEELGPRRDEMCGHVRSFLVAAPGTIAALRGRVGELMGRAPESPVYFASALQWTDGRAETFEGRDVLALNARHETFARTSGLTVTIAHELIHDAQKAAMRGEDEQLAPIARALFSEGAAVYGVQLLFPEIGSRALGLRPEQIERAEVVAPQAASEILTLLRAADGQPRLRRFFHGGVADAVYPPKMGYYLGNAIFRSLARRQGDVPAARATPGVFLAEAETYLSELGHRRVDVPSPQVDLPAVVRLRDDFLARARARGIALSFVPEVREWTRPSLTSWRQEERAVAIPRWEELSEPQRDLLARMTGDEHEARRVFDLLFRWFLVAHELAHALQDNASAARLDYASGERLANDVAVTFLDELPEARRTLYGLAPVLVRAAERLPPLSEFRDQEALNRFFDEHYDELTRDLPRYGAFQLHFILDSFRRVDRLRFEEAIQKAVRP